MNIHVNVKAMVLIMALASSDAPGGPPAQTRPELAPGRVLGTLDRSHPRLMLKDADLAALKKQIDADPLLRKCRDDVLKKADAYCRQPPVAYKLTGPRLLSVSRDCLHRVYALGLAWRLTGKGEYAAKATENLLAACAFADWNPSHFLDTAELSHAVGVGYDWLFHHLDEPTRAKIRRGLIDNALAVDLETRGSQRNYGWWRTVEHNWNQVCNSGLMIGALAVAETDPQYAQRIIPAALASMPKALATYDPDGGWPEGPGYWGYATSYTVFGLAALNSALGTDFGLSKSRGLGEAGLFPLLAAGPTGLFFNFADDGQDSRRGITPCLFWLARRYDQPACAAAERAMLANRPADPLDLVWYQPAPEKAAPLPLDKLFRGPVEIAVFRSAWDDPNALFVACKAGYNQVNHGHLDLGSFVLDAMGTRWVRDLGSDDYNLPGYWERAATGRRWTYYRLGSFSHNVPTLDGRGQDVHAKSRFRTFSSTGPDGGSAVIDLTAAYRPASRQTARGVALLAGRRTVLVQDEFDLVGQHDVAWGITTDAAAAVDGPRVELARDGARCTMALLSPGDGAFVVESARQPPPQKDNAGVSRVVLRLKQQTGRLRIAVLFRPHWPGQPKEPDAPKLVPLAEWIR